jgi:type I restriction enzyme S subunit
MGIIGSLIAKYCQGGVEFRQLGSICSLSRGRVISKEYLRDNAGRYPVYSSQTCCTAKTKNLASSMCAD